MLQRQNASKSSKRKYVFMHKRFLLRENVQNEINIIRKIEATKETLIPDYAVTIICQFIFYLSYTILTLVFKSDREILFANKFAAAHLLSS